MVDSDTHGRNQIRPGSSTRSVCGSGRPRPPVSWKQRDPEQGPLPLEPLRSNCRQTGQVVNLDHCRRDRWQIGCGCQEGEETIGDAEQLPGITLVNTVSPIVSSLLCSSRWYSEA